jgi:ribose transport system ATP-binding protein
MFRDNHNEKDKPDKILRQGSGNPLLKMVGITKIYPGVIALNKVAFDLFPGEVHCLVGENGAGKSTLVKILAGAEEPDEGDILVEGKVVKFYNPLDSQNHGIGVIYQDFKLVPYLSVTENILLGHLPQKLNLPCIDWSRSKKKAREILREMGEQLPLDAVAQTLTVAQQQIVEIARVLSREVRIIAMDEPSATLTARELENLFRIIRELKQAGVGIIYISHRLEEIFEIGDRVTILRDGHLVKTDKLDNLTQKEIVRFMVGREIKSQIRIPKTKGRPVLKLENLSHQPKVKNISFELYEGEIFCLSGLVGSGRTELAQLIFGAVKKDNGKIIFKGREINPKSPREAIDLGIGLLTEDRNGKGLIMDLSVLDNIILSNFSTISKVKIQWKKAQSEVSDLVRNLQIKTPHIFQKVKFLSGGNRQKVVLARWLFSKAKLLIFDEPTWGIDVGVKQEIYNLLFRLVEQGIGVLVISSDLQEVLTIGDRIGVMFDGHLRGILDRENASREKIMELATT